MEDLGPGHIMGNLTEDPELRFTPSGRAVTKVRICYRDRIKDPKTEQWFDGEPEFYTLNVWGKQAEHCAEALAKGDRVVAAGSWSKRPWTTREGEARISVELTVRDIGPSLLFRSAEIQRPDPAPEGARNDS
jgi:single-strand DNA-binding protein